jgi:phosphoribosyl-ATP pyrophosphohydrolase/phosphoribosyl-AMP cyclohydrolase
MQNITGLIPAIVQDYYTGKVLMLAYVNQESYDYMLKNGETCFWSRSRKKLWHKGEVSGNVQKIKNMAFDCDSDTLLIQVEQTGACACHTGSYSCFGVNACEYEILDEVYNQIIDRKNNPKEKSYTNYLLEKGIDKICKKVGEEASEVIIAAKNENKDDLIAEIADLAYHLEVLMFTSAITPKDIRAKFAQRHAKEGNLKITNKKGDF